MSCWTTSAYPPRISGRSRKPAALELHQYREKLRHDGSWGRLPSGYLTPKLCVITFSPQVQRILWPAVEVWGSGQIARRFGTRFRFNGRNVFRDGPSNPSCVSQRACFYYLRFVARPPGWLFRATHKTKIRTYISFLTRPRNPTLFRAPELPYPPGSLSIPVSRHTLSRSGKTWI